MCRHQFKDRMDCHQRTVCGIQPLQYIRFCNVITCSCTNNNPRGVRNVLGLNLFRVLWFGCETQLKLVTNGSSRSAKVMLLVASRNTTLSMGLPWLIIITIIMDKAATGRQASPLHMPQTKCLLPAMGYMQTCVNLFSWLWIHLWDLPQLQQAPVSSLACTSLVYPICVCTAPCTMEPPSPYGKWQVA